MTGTLANTTGPSGPFNQDMILAKVDDASGTLTWGFRWINAFPGGTTRSGDLPGEAIAVRNGEAFTAGNNFDTSSPTGPDMESALLLHFDNTGGGVLGIEELGGPSSSGVDNGLGLDFATTGPSNDIVWAGSTTSFDLPINGSYGGGTDGFSARSVVMP
jgi:hypothetical protein